MNPEMHGKIIDYIELDPSWTQCGHPQRVSSRNGYTLWLSVTYHGDHDQTWIVLSRGDIEVSRYSTRAVNHIRWAAESETEVRDDSK